MGVYDHTSQGVVHGDCYVTITVYLHKTPVYPSPWNNACYIMITLDSSSTSTIQTLGIHRGVYTQPPTPRMAVTSAVSTHPTGMLSCCICALLPLLPLFLKTQTQTLTPTVNGPLPCTPRDKIPPQPPSRPVTTK